MSKQYDVIVIGGGPGGYTSAIAAAKQKKRTALFEKALLGGTCLNVGCIPTKFLLDKAATIEKIRHMTGQGIFREAGSFSFKKIQTEKGAVVKRLTGGVSYLLKNNGVDCYSSQAQLTESGAVVSGGQTYKAKDIVIATGSRPISLPIKGAELAVDSSEALDFKKVPKSMLVIGGGVIGLEMASAYNSYGTQVTVVELLNELCPGEEAAPISLLRNALEKKGIRILLGCKTESIRKQGDMLCAVCTGAQQEEIVVEKVLMSVGRQPNLSGIDAGGLGIKLDEKGFISVDAYMRTNLDHVYAVGDVAGGYQLAHAAFAEAEVAVANICGKSAQYNADHMPRCIYTSPAFAAVGITSHKAGQLGVNCVSGSFPYEANGMALVENAAGSVYVLTDGGSKKIIGVQIVGEGAPEMIAFATAAVSAGMTFMDFEKLIVAHPSLSEMLKEAVMDCYGKAVHK